MRCSSKGPTNLPSLSTTSSTNQAALLSVGFLLPLISCCLNPQSGNCFECVHIDTFVGTCTSLKWLDLLFHTSPGFPSTRWTRNSVSLCREWSSFGHVVNSWFVGIKGDATSCVRRSVCVFTCSSWMVSSWWTARPRPASGSAFVGIICQWLFASSCP